MLIASRLPARSKKALTWALQIYAVLSLGSMATMSIGAALVVATLFSVCGRYGFGIWDLFQEERENEESARYLQGAGILFFGLTLSLVVAHYAPIVIGENRVEVRFASDLMKGWYLFWPVAIAMALRLLDDDGRRGVFRTWLVTFGLISVIGVAQFFTGWPRPQAIPGLDGRFHATLFAGHHLSIASIWIFPFFAALDSWLIDRRSVWRWVWAVAAVLGAATLLLTYSRMLWAALPIGLLIWVIWALPRRRAIWVVGALILATAGAFSLEAVRNRATQLMGIGTRQDLWEANIELLSMRPFTGAGWHHNLEAAGWLIQKKLGSNDVFSGHAHNNVIEMLGGTGVVGFLAWLIWWIIVVRILATVLGRLGASTSVWGTPIFLRGLACAWVVFHLNGLTQVNFWESKVLHQLMFSLGWLLYWAGELPGDEPRTLRVGELA